MTGIITSVRKVAKVKPKNNGPRQGAEKHYVVATKVNVWLKAGKRPIKVDVKPNGQRYQSQNG
jgi:hypothetical protein